ncbi:hypothetical protein K431DRAFT_260352 [Polychaeton citri CBS 116435]|uniref:DUF8004 domain-containing protein n=1 Tax=Polychaeton citri CBS 116435 TaxID=1314669 RepID=A0A9P4QIM2_9PEZI|nr:hypothetical protein K431DRAFT_260352 [Polychaeton citri CBS 116435]
MADWRRSRHEPLLDSFSVPRVPAKGGASRIRRFDGLSQIDSNWDGLRKDKEIWSSDSDTLVHLYAPGTSKRGPSFRIPLKTIQDRNSSYLLDQCLHSGDSRLPSPVDDSGSDTGSLSPSESDSPYVLYIPIPGELTRQEAFSYHVTTRNYFAFVTGCALVGESLGAALIDLWARIQQWQPKSADSARLLKYCDHQGYMNFSGNPGYALSLLRFADVAKFRDTWVDAFAHCVGMHDKLDLSSEYEKQTNTTKALITRASLEMDLHISRVTKAVGGFLEEELGPEYLGLSRSAREHLDRFRSVLHSFYVEKLGYFPPSPRTSSHKQLWHQMHVDFQCLYEFLVDTNSNDEGPSNKTMLFGGVCVLQNVKAFDERHGYSPLPYPLPLIPESSIAKKSTEGQKGLRGFKLARTLSSSGDKMQGPRQALAHATNSQNPDATQNELVQEYHRFERQRLEEKITLQEARKVRWLLIYCTLQMLVSITKAPSEVRDTETPSYPLCVLTNGCPPWQEGEVQQVEVTEPVGRKSADLSLMPNHPADEAEDKISIHPDCEADSAEDYFIMSRKTSHADLTMTPPPLRVSTTLNGTTSLRSHVLSSIGNFARKKSLRRTATAPGSLTEDATFQVAAPPSTPPRTKSSYCEIVIQGYGNGMDGEEDRALRDALQQIESTPPEQARERLHSFDFGLDNAAIEPTMEDDRLDAIARIGLIPNWNPDGLHRNSSDASAPSATSTNTASFSPMFDRNLGSAPDTDASSVEDDEHSSNDYDEKTVGQDNREDEDEANYSSDDYGLEMVHPQNWKPASYQPSHSRPPSPTKPIMMPMRHSHSKITSLNAGCYMPSSRNSATAAKWGHNKMLSDDSQASSQYPDDQFESTQAADIVDEDARGRRRSRVQDQLKTAAGFNFWE